MKKSCHQHIRYYENHMINYINPVYETCQLISQCRPAVKISAVFIFIFVFILWKSWPRDLCGGKEILNALCEEYYNREVSGDICYALCQEDLQELLYCRDDKPDIKTFHGQHNLLVRVPVIPVPTTLRLPAGMSVDQFINTGSHYLTSILGHSNHHDLIGRLLQFADFNGNHELSLGEVQSVWRLMNNQEFLLLFLFRNQMGFPNINGTCGGLYRINHYRQQILYPKDKSGFLSPIVKSSYRWGFPTLHHRLKISVGLIELIMDLSETEGVPFYLCNISPTIFGYTDKYELIVTDLSELKSSVMLEVIFRNMTCVTDSDCRYSDPCSSICDKKTNKCTGDILQSPIMFICDILREYILVGSSGHFYYDLKRYLDKCNRMRPHMIGYSNYLNEFHSFLWDFIKNDAK